MWRLTLNLSKSLLGGYTKTCHAVSTGMKNLSRVVQLLMIICAMLTKMKTAILFPDNKCSMKPPMKSFLCIFPWL